MRFAISAAGLLTVAVLGLSSSAIALEAGITAIMTVTPTDQTRYLACEFTLDAGEALAGLDWFNNDQTAPFPRLILMEAEEGQPPALGNGAMILEEVSGASLTWGHADLTTVVGSSTGRVFAVFEIPADEELTTTGTGGGTGVGIRASTGLIPRTYLSATGQDWVQLSEDYEMAVHPQLASPKMPPPTLASLKERTEPTAPAEKPTTRLRPPTPNPSNPGTAIHFELASSARVGLMLYNLKGQRVVSLLDGTLSAGEHHVVWDGRDDGGGPASSGVYFVKLVVEGRTFSERFVLVK